MKSPDGAARRPYQSNVDGPPGSARALRRVVLRLDAGEITPQGFHRKFFGIDLLASSHPAAPEKRYRRAPALGRVLQEKREHNTRNREELPVHKKPEQQSTECQGRCVGFQDPFHVPFAIELVEPPGKCRFAFPARAQNPALGRAVDPLIEFIGRMFADAILLNHKSD